MNIRYIVWQDPLNNGVKLDPATVVQVWLGSGEAVKTYLKEVTSAGRFGGSISNISDISR